MADSEERTATLSRELDFDALATSRTSRLMTPQQQREEIQLQVRQQVQQQMMQHALSFSSAERSATSAAPTTATPQEVTTMGQRIAELEAALLRAHSERSIALHGASHGSGGSGGDRESTNAAFAALQKRCETLQRELVARDTHAAEDARISGQSSSKQRASMKERCKKMSKEMRAKNEEVIRLTHEVEAASVAMSQSTAAAERARMQYANSSSAALRASAAEEELLRPHSKCVGLEADLTALRERLRREETRKTTARKKITRLEKRIASLSAELQKAGEVRPTKRGSRNQSKPMAGTTQKKQNKNKQKKTTESSTTLAVGDDDVEESASSSVEVEATAGDGADADADASVARSGDGDDSSDDDDDDDAVLTRGTSTPTTTKKMKMKMKKKKSAASGRRTKQLAREEVARMRKSLSALRVELDNAKEAACDAKDRLASVLQTARRKEERVGGERIIIVFLFTILYD